MNLGEFISTARDAITVKRVFSEPYQSEGVTVIAAASVAGGAGGGSGQGPDGSGDGGGFGVGARPAGAYVIRGGKVSWVPAVDVNRLIGTLGVVAVAYLLTRAYVDAKRHKHGIVHLPGMGTGDHRPRVRLSLPRR